MYVYIFFKEMYNTLHLKQSIKYLFTISPVISLCFQTHYENTQKINALNQAFTAEYSTQIYIPLFHKRKHTVIFKLL